jgi:thioester reductase-like protein
MSLSIEWSIAGSSGQGGLLAEDLVLEESIAPGVSAWDGCPPRQLLLTGATGFLGGHILEQLLRRTTAQVHCLIRRAPDRAEELLRRQLDQHGLAEQDIRRVHAVAGNLSSPLLGVGRARFDAIARTVDTIVHCGAWVNLTADYDHLRAPNVGGTREILRLATTARLKPVHHISTVGALFGGFERGLGVLTEDVDLPPPATLGYARTKWAGEKLVAVARDRGVPVVLHRPGVIFGDSRSGRVPRADWLTHLTWLSLRTGFAPEHNFLMPVSTVDLIASAVAEMAGGSRGVGEVFHDVNSEPLHFDQYFDLVRASEPSLGRLPWADWLRSIGEARDVTPAELALARSLDLILPTSPPGSPTYLDSTHFRRTISELGLHAPEIDAPLIARFVASMADGN